MTVEDAERLEPIVRYVSSSGGNFREAQPQGGRCRTPNATKMAAPVTTAVTCAVGTVGRAKATSTVQAP